MPGPADLIAQIGLVLFAQALAFATVPGPSEAETRQPIIVTISAPEANSRAPVEIVGPVVNGKHTDRLVPAATIVAQSEDKQRSGHGERNGPPPEAISACEVITEGAACSFTGRDGAEIEGICLSGPRGEPAACAPEGGNLPGKRT